MRSSALGLLLALAASVAGAAPVFAQVDIPDATADACDYQNDTTAEAGSVPVEVDAARGKPEYGNRICKADTSGWPASGGVTVRFRARRSATGEVSAWLEGTLPRAVPSVRLAAAAAAPPPPAQESLWANATPVSPDTGADSAVTLGVRFSASKAGRITGLRFWKFATNTGAHVGNVWSAAGAKLATITFSGETASGWQTAMLASPVPVAAGTVYVASYQALAGHYAFTTAYFVAPYTSGSLTATAGTYAYGAAPTFPASTYQSGNYWVDVVFEAD